MYLSDNEKRDIQKYIEAGKPLPDKYRFLLFEEKQEVELVWNGKTSEVTNTVLQFQVIEQVDEPRSNYTEKYKDYIHLGFLEWKKVYDEHIKLNKKAVLFLMTDDTKNFNEVLKYLENTYPELKDAVLVIHTKDNGEISESVTGKKEEELKILRQAANEIDRLESPHKAIVSVLMLKEGWDVKNVTTIVGLRAYTAQSNILPEQTLGRGLRRMYRDPDLPEFRSEER